jgi:putative oxidoreductase
VNVVAPLARALSRPLLAGMFVYGGLDAVRNPGAKAARARTVTDPLTESLAIDEDAETLVRINGAVQVGAGIVLAIGRFPRLSALVLAGSLVPTTLAGHRFWAESDPAARAQQTIQFAKNAAMLGGLLAVIGSEGPTARPSAPASSRTAGQPSRRARSWISAAARMPDSIAPWIHAWARDACSPAKWMRPSGAQIAS